MDSHNSQRYVMDGAARNEGDVQVACRALPGLLPRDRAAPREATNLLVPVALSATHIAYGSIRMEPVFMILGQSAATAASLALDGNGVVQDVPTPGCGNVSSPTDRSSSGRRGRLTGMCMSSRGAVPADSRGPSDRSPC